MVSVPGGEGAGAGWGEAQDRMDPRTALRMALGLLAVLVIVVAGLALLNSFFIEYAPGDPDTQPGGGDEGVTDDPGDDEEGGGKAPTCETYERSFFWIFIVLAVIAVLLFGVAVARREHSDGRIGSSIWGILSVVATFLALMAFGGYRIMVALCEGALTCGSVNDSTYSTFLFLLFLTLGAIAIGIGLSHYQKRHFLGTGWGLLGLLTYLPTVIVGFAWFLIRTLCTPELSCATRDEFLATLATIFWLALVGAALATGIGIFVSKRFDHPVFKSGWGILAILLALLAAFSGAGHMYVDGLYIPGCDEPPEFEEPEEKTCEEIRDDIRDRIANAALIVLLIVIGLVITGMVLHRHDRSRFWTSVWAILAYVGLGLLLLIGLAYLLAGSLCDDGEPEGDEGEGSGDDDSGGGGNGGDNGGGGNPGNGNTGSGGPDSGRGGGGGGVGEANPVLTPVEIDPASLTWVLVALLVVIGLAALVVLLRYRRIKEGGDDHGPSPAAADAVQAKERRELMSLLVRGQLDSGEAVIAAYRSFVAWSAARGLGLQHNETPREHAVRVGAKYVIPAGSMRSFIAAYEVARLSQHLPTADERDQAVRFAKSLASTPTADPATPAGTQEERL